MNKTCLIFGGSGALGRSVISHFKSLSIITINIDSSPNPEASTNINFSSQDQILASLKNVLGKNSLDSIINVAGGWAGGNASSPDLLEKSSLMFDKSVKSAFFAASIASSMLKESGVLVLVGAAAALEPTPGMLAYGAAKASVHHLVKSFGSLESGLPKNAICTGICPVILDTPNNRKWMPNEDFSTWTPLQDIALKFGEWTMKSQVPVNGGLYKLITKDNLTCWDLYIIASTWDDQDLAKIDIACNDQLWGCKVSDLKAPLGMELFTFTNLLKEMFLFDTSAMSIYMADQCLKIDCNHSSDGLTFTLASFSAEPSTGTLSFYQNSIMALIEDNVQKTKTAIDLQDRINQIQGVNAELQKELSDSTLQHLKSKATFTTVFKRIVNSKKRKIRILSGQTTE